MNDYFVSALSDEGETFVQNLQAETFDAARVATEVLAQARFGATPFRLTSVVEQPRMLSLPRRHIGIHLGSPL